MKGSITPKGPGVWYLRFDVPTDDGKRKQVRRTVRGTKRDAEQALRRFIAEAESGTLFTEQKLTVADYLQQWITDGCEGRLALKTIDWYRMVVDRHLSPTLGRHRLAQLGPAHLAKYFTTKRNAGLSETTLLGHYRTLHKALNQAVRWQLLTRNVADAIDPPRGDTGKRPVYDADQLAQLLGLALGTPYFAPVSLAVMAGMRRGEVMGLQWQDVDFKRGFLSIRRSLIKSSAGLSYKAPKGGQTVNVSMPEALAEILHQHRAEQEREKAEAGEAWEENGLVCAALYGQRWNPDRFSKSYGDWLARHPELPRIRYHDLRHSHASFLLHQGVALTTVRDRLGHSTIRITGDTYGHTLPPQQQDAADKIDERFRGGRW